MLRLRRLARSADDHFLINETTAFDAELLETLSIRIALDRARNRHPRISITSRASFLLENVFGRRQPIEIAAPAPVLKSLADNIFNDAVWPDFTRLPSRRRATARLRAIPEEGVYTAEGLAFRPVRVNHIVPTFGYLVSTSRASILFSGDTGPTRALWTLANSAANLKAIFLEVSFSNAQERIARASKHLTPKLVLAELSKTTRDVPVYLYHLKPPSAAEIRREVRALKMPRLKILKAGDVLEF